MSFKNRLSGRVRVFIFTFIFVCGGLGWAQTLQKDILPTHPGGVPLPSEAQMKHLPEDVIEEEGVAPLKASISQSAYLPPAMYGHWSLRATLIRSNRPEVFSQTIQDVWVLERIGEQVIVSNPATGGSAAVQVDQVVNDTATFHHKVPEGPKRFFLEQPTVTVAGDRLYGQTLNRVVFYRPGDAKPVVYYGLYTLEAERLGGARLEFGRKPSSEHLEFDIAPVQRAPR